MFRSPLNVRSATADLACRAENQPALVIALRAPERAACLSPALWDQVLRQGRAAGLLGQLHARLQAAQVLDRIPAGPRVHLESARILADRQCAAVRWEVNRVTKALAPLGVPIVLLKGAAYAVAGLPPAAGRLFSDVDIMVPKSALPAVEARLAAHGWITAPMDRYDQLYYRRWMHELPPMRHVQRKTTLDVHHTILPETARATPDAQRLFAERQPVGEPDVAILCAPDLVLHSATHLFYDGEFDHALRDLLDIDGLLRHYANTPNFWPRLTRHARHHGLGRPLLYALDQLQRWLGRPVPAAVMQGLRQDLGAAGRATLPMMRWLFTQGLKPDHPSCAGPLARLARGVLYIRGHYLRMPLHLLLPHLTRKTLRSIRRDHDRAS